MNSQIIMKATFVFWGLALALLYFTFSLEMPTEFALYKSISFTICGLPVGLAFVKSWASFKKFEDSKRFLGFILVAAGLLLAVTPLANFSWFVAAGLDYLSFSWVYFFNGSLELGLILFVYFFIIFRLKSHFARDQQKKVFQLERQKHTHLIPTDDIFYLRSAGDYVAFHTTKGEFLKRDTLKNLGDTLDVEQFIRIHRNAIINVKAIKTLKSEPNGDFHVELISGDKVRGSRRFKAGLNEKLSSA